MEENLVRSGRKTITKYTEGTQKDVSELKLKACSIQKLYLWIINIDTQISLWIFCESQGILCIVNYD